MANQDIQFDVNIDAVQRLIKEMNLNTKEARRAIRLGLAQSGRIIRNQARTNLRHAYCKGGKIHSEPMKRFVRSGVFKNLGGTIISISGNHRKRYVQRLAKKVSKI